MNRTIRFEIKVEDTTIVSLEEPVKG